LAAETKNYTGAEIEAVCRSATSYALFMDLDLTDLSATEEAKTTKGKSSSTKKPDVKKT
jgi:SpoVK/Ycf46/Vps4 family AAA+-type ATPase